MKSVQSISIELDKMSQITRDAEAKMMKIQEEAFARLDDADTAAVSRTKSDESNYI